MKKIILLLMTVFLALGTSAQATSLFDNTLAGYTVDNRAQASTDLQNVAGDGYTSSDYSGLYIGTVVEPDKGGANDSPVDLEKLISHYLGVNYVINAYSKIDVDNGGAPEGNGGPLTLTGDTSGGWATAGSLVEFYSVKGATEYALYYVNPAVSSGLWTTRHVSTKSGNQPQISHFTAVVSPVPEPATMFLLGTGLVGLAGVSRRKKTQK